MERFKRTVLFALAAILLVSCEAELKTISRPVDIKLEINQSTLKATKVYINASPAKDLVWYYWDVIKCSEFDNKKQTDYQFMDLAIDGAFVDYMRWRHDKLEAAVPFISNFASHSLSYGPTSYYFTGLEPDTEYYVYAFCVNSDTNKPIGDIHLKKFKTNPNPSPDYRNPMVIDFEVNCDEVMVVPSVEGLQDYYIWSLVDVRDLEPYDGNLEKYVVEFIDEMTRLGNLRYMMVKGIDKQYMRFEDGAEYILVAGAYDANFEKNLYVRRFKWEDRPDFHIERGHDIIYKD